VLQNTSIVVDAHGLIAKIGPAETIEEEFKDCQFDNVINCSGYCVVPGFVDAHTHALFLGDRSKEFDMKLHGKNYVDIYNEGLGIRFTTQSIREAPLEQLEKHLEKYLDKISRLGTTTIEVKSGYGLDTENEIKMLQAIKNVGDRWKEKIEVVSTYCGAHAIPKGKTEEEQTLDVLNNQIPAIHVQHL
jgi:imidazolonepropionase